MALVLPSLSDAPSVGSSRAEQVEHFRGRGLTTEVSEALYMAQRLQDKGQVQQAIMYYTAVLRAEPSCEIAKSNLNILVSLNRPEVQQILATALAEEETARLAAEEEEAARVAAEAAAQEEQRQREAAAKDEEERLARAKKRRRAAEDAAKAEEERQALARQAADKARRIRESFQFVSAKLQEQKVREENVKMKLRSQFPELNIGDICINDVRLGNGGFICRSTHNSIGIGLGWSGYQYTAASSGRTYDSRDSAPEPCFNCGEYHFRRFCPYHMA